MADNSLEKLGGQGESLSVDIHCVTAPKWKVNSELNPRELWSTHNKPLSRVTTKHEQEHTLSLKYKHQLVIFAHNLRDYRIEDTVHNQLANKYQFEPDVAVPCRNRRLFCRVF